MKKSSTNTTEAIKNVLLKLSKSPGPATELLRSGDGFSVIAIGLNRGDILPDHTTDKRTRLIVLVGSVLYQDPDNKFPLFDYDEHEIPVGVVHNLTATKKSICLLIKG